VLLVEVHRIHAPVEHVESLLALGSTDDLADAGSEYVHGRDGFLVVVEAHIERLDVFRVVHYDYGPANVVGQEALVLGLQIQPPFHGELEALAGLLEDLDGIGVRDAVEARLDEFFHARDALLVDAIGEELHVVRPLVQERAEDRLEESLGQVGVGVEVGKGDLRLDHPELGQVARGKGMLGTKGGAERVYLRQGQAIGLDIQLARDGQERGPAEEVFREIDLPRGSLAKVRQIERGNSEHCAGAFGVAGSDDRRMDPVEPVFVKELVGRHRERVAYARHCAKGVRAWPKMGHFTQEFECVVLRLDGIGIRIFDPAQDLHVLGLHFDGLSLAVGAHQFPRACHSAAGGDLQDLAGVVRQRVGGNDLDGVEA
jgi:hypothetical protein